MIPLLLPAAIALLPAGGGSVVAALAFPACCGIGNGLITLVKAIAIAQYVSHERVAALSGLPQPAAVLARPLLPGGPLRGPGAGHGTMQPFPSRELASQTAP